jgi:DNA-binding transcriptional MerR regulator
MSRIFDSEYKIKDNTSQNMDKKQKRFISLLNKYYKLGWETTNISPSKTRRYSNIHSLLQTIDTAVFKIYVQHDSIQLFERSILRDKKSNKEIRDFLHKNTMGFHNAVQKANDLKKSVADSPMPEWKEIMNYIDSYITNVKSLWQDHISKIDNHLKHTTD